MKKQKILFLFYITLSFSFAQNLPYTVLKSEIFKDKYKESEIVASEEDNNGGVYIIRSFDGNGITPNSGYYIEHFDKELKLLKDFHLKANSPFYQKSKMILGLFIVDKKFYFSDMFFDLKLKAYVCQMTTVDLMDFTTTTKELFNISQEELNKLGTFKLNVRYDLNDSFNNLSNNEKNTGAMMRVNKNKTTFSIILDINAGLSKVYKMYLFDKQLNLKFEKRYERQVKDYKFQLQDIEISPDGEAIYLAGKVLTNAKQMKETGGKYQFELTKITMETNKTKAFDTNNHYVNSLKTVFIKNQLILAGFYSDKNDNRYKGVCFYEFSSDNLDLKTKKFNPFTEQFLTDKYGDKKPKELKNLLFKEVLYTENDGLVINAEEDYLDGQLLSTIGKSNNNTFGINNNPLTPLGQGNTTRKSDDIVSVKLDLSGNLIWSRNINKAQYYSAENGNSFVSFTSVYLNNQVYFFINAKEKIKNLDNGRIEFRGTRESVFNLNLIKIVENGDYDFQKILDHEENEVPFMVSRGVKSGNSVFFLGKKGAKKQLLKVSL